MASPLSAKPSNRLPQSNTSLSASRPMLINELWPIAFLTPYWHGLRHSTPSAGRIAR